MTSFPFPIGVLHIIGIGGIGMSGYAALLHALGYKVQGSDAEANANTARLETQGIKIFKGHAAAHIHGASVIVRSTAVRDDNPEVVAARALNIPVIARVDLLREMMRNKWCVNISGTHGKTTTTSMIGHVLETAGLDPTVINGGIVNAYGSNTRLGQGDWMVVESDESDGTFRQLPSVASIITNIDPEHLDHYGGFDGLKQAFIDYAHNLPFYGRVIACSDCKTVRTLLPQFDRQTITYGFEAPAQIRAENLRIVEGGILFDVSIADDICAKWPRRIHDIMLPMFGRHNVLNALASLALAHEAGVEVKTAAHALSRFGGVKRRFTHVGTVDGIKIIDDYAHHPAEIRAVLSAAREAQSSLATKNAAAGKIIAVFQPHRYTRLRDLFADFAAAFDRADAVIVAPVYAAGEKPMAGAGRDDIAAAIRKNGHAAVYTLDDPAGLASQIAALTTHGDMVLCLGAGSVTQWAAALPAQLAALKDKERKIS